MVTGARVRPLTKRPTRIGTLGDSPDKVEYLRLIRIARDAYLQEMADAQVQAAARERARIRDAQRWLAERENPKAFFKTGRKPHSGETAQPQKTENLLPSAPITRVVIDARPEAIRQALTGRSA